MMISETTAEVDDRGNVTVAVPEPFHRSGNRVRVVLSTPEPPRQPITQQEWVALIDRTAGCIDDESFVRPEQPPIPPAPDFD